MSDSKAYFCTRFDVGRGKNNTRLWGSSKCKAEGGTHALGLLLRLHKGTRLALIAPANDEDSHKDAPSRLKQQTAAGYNAKGKHTPNAGKRRRPTAKPIEDVLVGKNVFVNTGMGMMGYARARVTKTAGNDTYQVRLAKQDKIVKSLDMLIRVSELATHHWPLLHDRISVAIQRRDPDGFGPSTFNGHIVKLKEAIFTVEGENGVTHETRADEMLIAADMVLNVLRPRRPITKQRPSRTPPPQHDQPLQDAHGAPSSREEKGNLDMVATYIGETRLSPGARGRRGRR